MGIADEDIARVRANTDLVALVEEYVQLRQVGSRWRGLCPFHGEKTPSFYVNPAEGFWHCFGCQMNGDAISFVQQMEHLDFPETMERLAGKIGISLTYDKPGENRTRAERKRMAALVERAEAWYHERLLVESDAAEARRYLRDRGFDGDEVRSWRLGWAPDDWDQLARALQIPKKDLKPSGLGFENKRGRAQDHFRGRVLFPIHDADGTPVGFGGRVLPGHEGSKYVNSPQSPLYDKSRVLFALDRAKAGIVEANEVIVCEGYTDVTAFFRVGLPRAVATCGTALTEDHVRLLRKFARRIVLAFDADAAGNAAADRFYEWEAELDIDVVVAAMPDGVDPAELAATDPDALRAAVAQARSFLEFRLDRVFEGADLDSPEHRARVAEAALAVIAEHPNDLVRDSYLMRVADRCRLAPDVLRDRLRRGDYRRPQPSGRPARNDGPRDDARGSIRAPARQGSRHDERDSRGSGDDDPGPREPGDPVDRDEQRSGDLGQTPTRPAGAESASAALEVLRLAVHRPADVVEWLEPCLFDRPIHQQTLDVLGAAETLHEAMDAAPPDVAALLAQLVVEECVEDPLDPVLLLVSAFGRRLVAAERAKPDADLGVLTTLARLLNGLGPGLDGVSAARELLSFAALEGVSG